MAYTDTQHAAAIGTNTGKPSGFLAIIRNRMTQYGVYRRTFTELDRLSDRDLADLGLSRSMIQSVAHDAAYGAR